MMAKRDLGFWSGRFDLDLRLRELSVDGSLCVEQRILAGLCCGVDPVWALQDCSALLAVVSSLGCGDGRYRLADLLERPRGELVRALYFAQAGRGLSLATANLRWLEGELRSRVAVMELCCDEDVAWRRPSERLDGWISGFRFVVDRSSIAFGRSLVVDAVDRPVCAYDMGLIGLSLKGEAGCLVRVLAGLSIGVGIDDAVYCVLGVIEALDRFRRRGDGADGLLREILSGQFDDYQRALVFACFGRDWHDVFGALGTLREYVEARARQWAFSREAGIDGGRRVSPYVSNGAPEACVFMAMPD